MIALYDMRFMPTTYDYFNWLCHVKLLGATKIHFRVEPMRQSKYPAAEGRRRFHNFIWPAPELFGLDKAMGNDGDASVGSLYFNDLQADAARMGKDIPRMRSVRSPAKEQFTVTIRDTFRNVHKNSDRVLWEKFAARTGAYVIDDHAKKPMELHDRIAFYAGAEMNFGVVNGPLAALYYSPYPFAISCDPVTSAKSFGGHKIKPGDRCPYFLPNQRWIWERPTMDGLMRVFDGIQATV